MNFTIELEQEVDGRWIAEIPELRGALVYGQTREEAISKGQALALRVLAEQLEHKEATSDLVHVTLTLHEPVALNKSQKSSCRTSPYWLDNQTAVGLSPYAGTCGLD